MIRIIVADDHTLVRQGLRRILEAESDMEVVGEARDAAEVFRLLAGVDIDVLILDISMPGAGGGPSSGGGFDVLRQLKSQHRPRVLIVSMHPEARFATRTLKLGAAGYVTKDRAAEELVEAIRRIHRGGKYISPELAELLAFDLISGKPPHERLSHREMEVFLGIAAGKRTTEIAQELCLAVATVHTYHARIFEKMHFKSSADLVRYALDHDLLD